MGLSLYPSLIKIQARSSSSVLQIDNVSLMTAREKINDFLTNETLLGNEKIRFVL